MSMKVRAFVDHLARSFGRPPCWDARYLVSVRSQLLLIAHLVRLAS
jgi:hypothetical protein